MNRSSEDPDQSRKALRAKIIGLGEHSLRKSYYPQLQQRLEALEDIRRKLADSEARYRSLVENIDDVIFSLDPQGIVTYISPAIQTLSGFSPEQFTGHPFCALFGETAPEIIQSIQSGSSRRCELKLTDKNGACHYVHASSRPLLVGGKVVGSTGILSDITERKRIQDALQESEATFRTMIETIPIAIYSSSGGVEQNLEYMNPKFVELFGYTQEEVPKAEHWWPLAYPDENYRKKVAEEWNSRVARAVETKSAIEPMEVEIACKDGSKKTISWGFIPTGRANYAYALDLTERKTAEKALWESSQMLRLVLENMPASIFWKDRNSVYLGCNHIFASHAGFSSPEEIVGLTDFDLPWQPQETEIYRRDDQRVMETGIPKINYEETLHAADGRDSWVRTSKVPLKGPQGNVIGVLGAYEDISERRRAEEALRESEESLRTLTESMPQLVWMCRPDGWFVYFNQRWVEYTGMTLEESYGHGWNKPFHPEDQQRAWEAWQNATQTGGKYDLECRLRKADDSYHWFLVRGLPLRNSAGEIVKWFGTCTDIDDQKLAQEEVRKMNLELDQRVRQRTLELAKSEERTQKLNEELQQRATMLEATNKELEAFSYCVSHDLRAPLRSMEGFSQILLEDYSDKLGDEGREFLSIIREASQRMAQLIGDILQLSRITRSDLRRSRVDLSDLARTVCETLQRDEPQRKLEFVIAPDCIAQADGNLMRIVLENLIGNAWKFTSKTPAAKIEFGCEKGDEHVFYVRDNGAGFDSQQAHKLFGAFVRLHTAKDFPGTGIGLASVQRIIHRHGGRVWIEGKLGAGATVYFTLPFSGGPQNGVAGS